MLNAAVVGLAAFALPLALLLVWTRRTLAKAKVSKIQVERANDELCRSNTDLEALLGFASGLLGEIAGSRRIAAFARSSVERLTGGSVSVTIGGSPPPGAITLDADGRVVGGLTVDGGDRNRWARLRDQVVRQLTRALDTATRAEETRNTHLETIAALSRSMTARDGYARDGNARLSEIAVALARRLGYTDSELDAIEIGAAMHDVGKIGIPESILHKPGPLDNDEWIVMRRYPVISELILSEVDLSPIVLQIARSSHERMDGQGYPDGLAGEEIPLPARIVLVADAFEALTTDRSYRRARRPKAALEEIVANSGDQFCPKVVNALKRLYAEEPAMLGEVALSMVAS
jgi:HD-GYP domain-containing protein (c-di-GMP phosphodiesterase class II)